jgi:hypothetical protein
MQGYFTYGPKDKTDYGSVVRRALGITIGCFAICHFFVFIYSLGALKKELVQCLREKRCIRHVIVSCSLVFSGLDWPIVASVRFVLITLRAVRKVYKTIFILLVIKPAGFTNHSATFLHDPEQLQTEPF